MGRGIQKLFRTLSIWRFSLIHMSNTQTCSRANAKANDGSLRAEPGEPYHMAHMRSLLLVDFAYDSRALLTFLVKLPRSHHKPFLWFCWKVILFSEHWTALGQNKLFRAWGTMWHIHLITVVATIAAVNCLRNTPFSNRFFRRFIANWVWWDRQSYRKKPLLSYRL